jgi:hypothetical protein
MRPAARHRGADPGREAILLQPLTGQAAVVAEADANTLTRLPDGGRFPTPSEETLCEARFVVTPRTRTARYSRRHGDYVPRPERTPTQLVVADLRLQPSCAYCYQEVFDPLRAARLSGGRGRPSPGSIATMPPSLPART